MLFPHVPTRCHRARIKPGGFGRCLVIVMLSQACERGRTPTQPPTDVAAPTAPTAPTAAAACPIRRASPLVLQLAIETRAAIEESMQAGIAVVAFDCHDVVPLASCHVEGSYTFTAAPRTDVDRRFTSREETRAAPPLWGTSTPPLAIEPDQVLTLQAVVVGNRHASVSRVAKRDLQGDCGRATHFIQAARLGAFALNSKRGTATEEAKSGSLKMCPAVTAGAKHPEPQCSTALQLALVPIDP